MAVRFQQNDPANTENLPQRLERKFYIEPNRVELAYGLLQQVCIADADYPSEQINSLYFDTADLEQYGRSASGEYHKNKIRIRWYGSEDELDSVQPVFIELKTREGFAGMKQRMKWAVPADALRLNNLSGGIITQTVLVNILAGFGFYCSQMIEPVVMISYWRQRFRDLMTGQHVALDYHIRSTMIMLGSGNGEKALELPGAVMEIKGETLELPITLMRAKMLYTDWTRFSKYTACVEAHGERLGSIGRLSPSGRLIQ